MLNVLVRLSSFACMFMYAGIGSCIFPRGPSISTVLPIAFLLASLPAFIIGGGKIVKRTSGGNESGALPIFERHNGVLEKARVNCFEAIVAV